MAILNGFHLLIRLMAAAEEPDAKKAKLSPHPAVGTRTDPTLNTRLRSYCTTGIPGHLLSPPARNGGPHLAPLLPSPPSRIHIRLPRSSCAQCCLRLPRCRQHAASALPSPIGASEVWRNRYA